MFNLKLSKVLFALSLFSLPIASFAGAVCEGKLARTEARWDEKSKKYVYILDDAYAPDLVNALMAVGIRAVRRGSQAHDYELRTGLLRCRSESLNVPGTKFDCGKEYTREQSFILTNAIRDYRSLDESLQPDEVTYMIDSVNCRIQGKKVDAHIVYEYRCVVRAPEGRHYL